MPSPDLPLADVRRIARLARLDLSPGGEQEADASRRLGAVLGYMDTLARVDVTNVPEMHSPLETPATFDSLRSDDPGPTLSAEALMSIAPAGAARPPFIMVPRVMGGSSGA